MSNWPSETNGSRFQMRLSAQVALQNSQRPNKMMTLEEFQELDKRIIAADRVMENFHINTWDRQFLYRPVNPENLQSLFLDQNALFQDLRQMLDEYNKEVRDAEQANKNIRNGAWRSVFYAQLLNLMREIMLTTNRDVQQKFIEKAHRWAQDQLQKLDYQSKKMDKKRPETGKTRPYSAARPYSAVRPVSGARPISGITGILGRPGSVGFTVAGETLAETTINMSFDESNAKLQTLGEDGTLAGGKLTEFYNQGLSQPSFVISEQMRDYVGNQRTKHDSVEPPKVRLDNYKRRLISYAPPPKPPLAPESGSKKTFTKPQSAKLQQQTTFIEPQLESDEALVIDEIQKKEIEQLKAQEDEKYKLLEPRIKTFKDDVQGADSFKRNLNEKFELRSSYEQYEPSNDVREMRLEEIYINKKHREVAQKREDEEFIGHIREWSMAKGRIEKEVNRRIESATIGNRFKQVQMQERSDKAPDLVELQKVQDRHQRVMAGGGNDDDMHLSDLSQEIQEPSQVQLEEEFEIQDEDGYIEGDSEMIEEEQERRRQKQKRPETVKERKTQLDLKEQLPSIKKQKHFQNGTDFHQLENKMGQQKIDRLKQLHGPLIKLENKQEEQQVGQSLSVFANAKPPTKYRPFSAALEKLPADKYRDDQIKEIVDIKNRLGKHRINIPVQKLMSAMLVPTIEPQQIGLPLPDYGANVMDYPFAKKKKKTKGGKKKRKN